MRPALAARGSPPCLNGVMRSLCPDTLGAPLGCERPGGGAGGSSIGTFRRLWPSCRQQQLLPPPSPSGCCAPRDTKPGTRCAGHQACTSQAGAPPGLPAVGAWPRSGGPRVGGPPPHLGVGGVQPQGQRHQHRPHPHGGQRERHHARHRGLWQVAPPGEVALPVAVSEGLRGDQRAGGACVGWWWWWGGGVGGWVCVGGGWGG